MKYFVKIISGVAMQVYRSDEAWADNDYEITEEQFASYALPCRAEVTEDGAIFGDIVPWEEAPDVGEVGEYVPEPDPAPEPTVWDDMAAAIMEGVNGI